MDKNKYGLLSQIKYPSDLRKLSVEQLPELCRELRQDIIDEVSVNPGHFASSLGVVEITVALHYVFRAEETRSAPTARWVVCVLSPRRKRVLTTPSPVAMRRTASLRHWAWRWLHARLDIPSGMS